MTNTANTSLNLSLCVTVIEKTDRAGGLLMYGIPHYKLRKEKVQRRIDLLEAEGRKL